MSTLTLAQRAQANTIREQAKIIVANLPQATSTTVADIYEDSSILITVQKVLAAQVIITVKFPLSSSSSSSGSSGSSSSSALTYNPVVVFAATSDTVTVFRHNARWVTYVNTLATTAQAIADAGSSADPFLTIDDSAVFTNIVASVAQPKFNAAEPEATPAPAPDQSSQVQAPYLPPAPVPDPALDAMDIPNESAAGDSSNPDGVTNTHAALSIDPHLLEGYSETTQ